LTDLASEAYKLRVPYEVQMTGAFDAWLGGLTDGIAKKAIFERIDRVQSGLLGDRRSVGERVTELRIDVGQGYRLYYTVPGPTAVLLLWGGNKKTQKRDIRKAEAMAKVAKREKKAPSASRVRERQAAYATEGGEEDEFHFTAEELKVTPFDVADYIQGDEETQLYLLRSALADGHPAYIANTIGIVARARGLSKMERATGIRRQTLNKSLSAKGNPTLETLMAVLGALGLKLDVVEDRAGSAEPEPAKT
jgi:putative addiction module killer protein/probable addiction module antidote protein